MATVTAKYLGDLRVECIHVASGTKLVSDAPVDNNGKGEAFSPTDLCVTALASCAMTIIGIYGKMHDVDVVGTEIEVVKTMSASPRRENRSDLRHARPRLYPQAEDHDRARRAYLPRPPEPAPGRGTGLHVQVGALGHRISS